MADINDLIIEMKKLTDSIAKSQSGGAAGSPQDQAVRNLKNLSDALEKQRKTLVSSNDTLGRWQRFLTNTTAGYKDLDSSLKNLDTQFEELERSARDAGRSITASEKARYDQERRNIENQQALRASSEELDAALRNTAKTLLQGVFSTAGTLVRDLQSNSSGVQVSGKLLSGAVGAATGAAEVLGNAMTTSGAAMMSLGGKFKWLGGIIGGLGLAVSGVSSAAGKLAKFGIEVLLTEVEKTIDAFQKSSNAGALFTDGMTGLRAAAAGAGLTVEQFGNVLRDNSQNLGRAGVGVAEAARTVGRVGVILKNSNVTEQLIKLGYGFEEQAALSAEVMSDMRRLGGVATDQQIAKQTQELAESFRLLSSITGEDAKKKAEQVRQQNQILAFQQVIATKTPEQQARINAAMSNMTEMEKRAFRDRVMFNGMVRDREAAIYESTLQGAREKGELLYRQLEDNSLTAESVANANAQYGRIIRESGLSQRELAQAGVVAGGALGNVAGGILEAVNQAGQYTDDAVRNAKQGIEGQKNATDSLTQGVVNATVAVQDFRIQLQQILLPFVNDFLRYSQAMLEITKKYTNEIAGVAGTATTPGATGGGSILEKFNVGGMVKGALGLNGIENMGMGEAMTRGALGTLGLGLGFLPGLGPGLRLLLGALGGYGAGNLGDAIFGKRALGGTAIGDRLYLVGEQGPELFRPSTSGEIVNNTVATSPSPSSDPMVSELVQLIKEQLMVNKLTLGTNEDLLQTMSDLRSIQQQFYNNSV